MDVVSRPQPDHGRDAESPRSMPSHRMKMPDLGEGVVEAELVKWLVHVGERVPTDSQIAEVMTDKASVEVSAPVAGTVTDLLVGEGSVVAVGSDLITFEGDPAISPPITPLESPTQHRGISRREIALPDPAAT